MSINENNALHYWAALAVFSIVSLSSMTNFLEDGQDLEREQKWAITVASVSLILAVFSFFLRIFLTKMFTSFLEYFAVFVVLVFWCLGLPYINDSANLLSLDTDGAVWNVNLFFSSWMAFIVSMKLFADMFPAKFMGDRFSTFTKLWIGFGTATLIVMTNAVMYWRDNCDSKDENNMCTRDLFAFVLGAVSGLFAFVFMVFNHERLEQVISIFLTAAWCFSVAYLTFDDGPAKRVGTFYFSIWFSFMFSLWMAVHSIVALFNEFRGCPDTPATEEVKEEVKDEVKEVQEETAKQDAEEHEKEEVAQEDV